MAGTAVAPSFADIRASSRAFLICAGSPLLSRRTVSGGKGTALGTSAECAPVDLSTARAAESIDEKASAASRAAHAGASLAGASSTEPASLAAPAIARRKGARMQRMLARRRGACKDNRGRKTVAEAFLPCAKAGMWEKLPPSHALPGRLFRARRRLEWTMSNHDSGRPPSREKRMVLRKIGSTDRDSVPDDGVDAAARLSAPAPQPVGAPSSGTGMPYPTHDHAGSARASSPTQSSLPPLVANVGERSRATSPPAARGPSTAKASAIGAAAGLAFVGMIVLGARFAYQEPSTAQASGGSKATPGEAFAASSASPSPSPPGALTASPPPTVLAMPLSTVAASVAPFAGPRHAPPLKPLAVAPGGMPPAAVAAKTPAEPGAPAAEPTSKGKAPSAAAAAPSSSSVSAEPADSAPSLVPVIPSSAPPEMDPLVKAVLEDNQK